MNSNLGRAEVAALVLDKTDIKTKVCKIKKALYSEKESAYQEDITFINI